MLDSPAGGLLLYRQQLGDWVSPGDVLAEIVDPTAPDLDSLPAVIKASMKRLRRLAPAVAPGRVRRFRRDARRPRKTGERQVEGIAGLTGSLSESADPVDTGGGGARRYPAAGVPRVARWRLPGAGA